MGFYGWVNETSDGRGIHREYDVSNLFQIGIVEQLSSLNIPTPGINFFMQRHFRYGIRMSALANDENEFPLVNVEMQMGKILVITKALRGKLTQPGRAEGPAYTWDSFLIEGPEGLFSRKNWSGIMILIDLAMIKKSVDSLIKMA
jgi:hypothetical protein